MKFFHQNIHCSVSTSEINRIAIVPKVFYIAYPNCMAEADTVFIGINAPGRCIFKGGGGGGGGGECVTINDKQNQISSPVEMGDNGHLLP